MAEDTVKTQGTALYFVDGSSIVKLSAPTGVSGLGGATDQIETTDLDATEDKTFVSGLGTPGQVSVPFNFKPSEVSQQTLFDLKAGKDVINWLLGLSDGATAPTTITSGVINAPTDRTCAGFDAFVADVVIDVATNEIVRGTLTLQRSGPVTMHWKA